MRRSRDLVSGLTLLIYFSLSNVIFPLECSLISHIFLIFAFSLAESNGSKYLLNLVPFFGEWIIRAARLKNVKVRSVSRMWFKVYRR